MGMFSLSLDDTIAGISAPTGGAISIVRISGPDAVAILKKIFKTNIKTFESHKIYYGWVVDGNNQPVDEVLASVMLAPKTFTTQDVVEINCHGGSLVTQKILELVLEAGARLAEGGEFTKRAFLAGRIDLSRAEAVMDIISAKSNLAHKAAASQLSGRLGASLEACRENLLNLAARIEMAIDYPEHEEADILGDEVKFAILEVSTQIDNLLTTARQGKFIREGIKTAIIGSPNAGKSSLLNALLDEERAIVTHIPGTTRDVLKETIKIGDIFLTISDTAGIRETEDLVESEGVARSLKEAAEADLVLLVVDGTLPQPLEAPLIDENWKNVIVVVNKMDLPQNLDKAAFEGFSVVEISAKNADGLENLTTKITEMFVSKNMEYFQEMVTNIRHINLLNEAKRALCAAANSAEMGMCVDLTAIDIAAALAALGEITGAVVDEELIEKIFSEFCLGK